MSSGQVRRRVRIFVEDAAEAVTSVDVQVGEPVRVGDRVG
jgi:hypothetical protein